MNRNKIEQSQKKKKRSSTSFPWRFFRSFVCLPALPIASFASRKLRLPPFLPIPNVSPRNTAKTCGEHAMLPQTQTRNTKQCIDDDCIMYLCTSSVPTVCIPAPRYRSNERTKEGKERDLYARPDQPIPNA
ncbi:hypothetical protein BU24DRAFT_424244 [Aaosphaeria arxii CBS 175.79]|uniref:Uncharacterized protein n=1 Tax=Aaosphaeria arxii CBS 175.79 TaxID=1450172 RepID=A0A6A5XK36_9PLEO|nr:uncharacterized protein BU24DRAFT_424244 [Aaosphaeria arxii CBS 175.79]KAF2013239.1 hypothetical protein BU24DRAFT_424244 [Aaosphaeria arxii CBS 175.79]